MHIHHIRNAEMSRMMRLLRTPTPLRRRPVGAGDVARQLLRTRVRIPRWPVGAGDVEIPPRWPVGAGEIQPRWPVGAGDVDVPLTLNGLNARTLMIHHVNDLIFNRNKLFEP